MYVQIFALTERAVADIKAAQQVVAF